MNVLKEMGRYIHEIKLFYLSLILQVLIPVFALGRAQELCILLESYWSVNLFSPFFLFFQSFSPYRERMNLKYPIYFSTGLTEKVLRRS